MTIPEELNDVLAADPKILSGAVRFKGTRAPVQALLDTIMGGESVDYFIDDFPGCHEGTGHVRVKVGTRQGAQGRWR